MSTEAPEGRNLRSDARRNVEAILEAARAALAEDPQTSMGQIARRAGVHRATVHRHFAAREDLVRALHARAREACLEAVEEAREHGGPPREALHRITRSWIEVADQYRLQQYGVLFAPGDAEVDQGTMGDDLVALLADGARAGELRDDVDPACLAALWAGMVLAGGQMVAQGARDADEAAAHVVRLIARG
jgi:TetR/AcrR family transcriptional regulator, mexCD-oprJ operon repressor